MNVGLSSTCQAEQAALIIKEPVEQESGPVYP
jgi:hypothetical protein